MRITFPYHFYINLGKSNGYIHASTPNHTYQISPSYQVEEIVQSKVKSKSFDRSEYEVAPENDFRAEKWDASIDYLTELLMEAYEEYTKQELGDEITFNDVIKPAIVDLDKNRSISGYWYFEPDWQLLYKFKNQKDLERVVKTRIGRWTSNPF